MWNRRVSGGDLRVYWGRVFARRLRRFFSFIWFSQISQGNLSASESHLLCHRNFFIEHVNRPITYRILCILTRLSYDQTTNCNKTLAKFLTQVRKLCRWKFDSNGEQWNSAATMEYWCVRKVHWLAMSKRSNSNMKSLDPCRCHLISCAAFTITPEKLLIARYKAGEKFRSTRHRSSPTMRRSRRCSRRQRISFWTLCATSTLLLQIARAQLGLLMHNVMPATSFLIFMQYQSCQSSLITACYKLKSTILLYSSASSFCTVADFCVVVSSRLE